MAQLVFGEVVDRLLDRFNTLEAADLLHEGRRELRSRAAQAQLCHRVQQWRWIGLRVVVPGRRLGHMAIENETRTSVNTAISKKAKSKGELPLRARWG